MRILRLLIATALVTAALVVPAAAQAALPHFGDGSWAANVGFGGAELGQTRAQAKRAWGSGGECSDFSCQYQDARRPQLGSATLSFEDGKRGRVSNLTITAGSDPRTNRPVFRTPLAAVQGPGGIKLGSSMRAVRAAYPRARAPGGANAVVLTLADRHRNTTLLFFSGGRLSRIIIQDDRPRG